MAKINNFKRKYFNLFFINLGSMKIFLLAIIIFFTPFVATSQIKDVPKDRNGLVFEDTLWQEALNSLGSNGKNLGYTSDEMSNYTPDEFVLQTVWRAFRNAKNIPRTSGGVTTFLLDSCKSMSAIVQRAISLTDVSAGRGMPVSIDSMWFAKEAKNRTCNSPEEAFDRYIAEGQRDRTKIIGAKIDYLLMPDNLKIFFIRIATAIEETNKWLIKAIPLEPFDLNSPRGNPIDYYYLFASAPWGEEHLGLEAVSDPRVFELMRKTDRKYLMFAATYFYNQIQFAIKEFTESKLFQKGQPKFEHVVLPTREGNIAIYGAGSDDIDDEESIAIIDIGGNDKYHGRLGTSSGFTKPTSLLIDLAGDDSYAETDKPCAFGCGLFGIGAVVDMSGNDRYHIRESGLGSGWFGVGTLFDFSGDDAYIVDSLWGQGAAHIGCGVLCDVTGDDTYTCSQQSQGLGSTLGVGFLIDVSGNDKYVARDSGNISALYLGQSVSMAQGCGYGRRADFGDGHSLAGGWGVLVDGKGDDFYSAPVWSQGCGYWWAIGILEDREGNDTYRSGKYSIGSAAHYGIGCKIDFLGDDKYAVGYNEAVNQYCGHARDGSIGISIDGSGNDRYYLKQLCGGSADLCSIGIFWDREGKDEYNLLYELKGEATGWADTPPLGTATKYEKQNGWRDDINSYGIFWDTEGDDIYNWDSKSSEQFYSEKADNNKKWFSHRATNSWGIGFDLQFYKPLR